MCAVRAAWTSERQIVGRVEVPLLFRGNSCTVKASSSRRRANSCSSSLSCRRILSMISEILGFIRPFPGEPFDRGRANEGRAQ